MIFKWLYIIKVSYRGYDLKIYSLDYDVKFIEKEIVFIIGFGN